MKGLLTRYYSLYGCIILLQSRTNRSWRVGYDVARVLLKKGVRPYSNSFTGDLVGIQISLEFIADVSQVENRNIHVFTDCQGVIATAFQNQCPSNKIEIVTSVKQHRQNISRKGNIFHVHWVPGHDDIAVTE